MCNLTVQDLIVNSTSTFFGEVVFKDKVYFAKRPVFTKDSAGEAIIKSGTNSVKVTFDEEFENAPLVNASLMLLGNPTDKQKLLDEGYVVGISDKSATGFTIQINKKAITDIKLNWSAVETK